MDNYDKRSKEIWDSIMRINEECNKRAFERLESMIKQQEIYTDHPIPREKGIKIDDVD
jgi:hypothetical protein